jgi:hypothetical protein
LNSAEGRSPWLRRRVLLAALVVTLALVGAALLLWPDEPKPAPAPKRVVVQAAPNPDPPLAYVEPKPKPRPKPKPKPKPRLRIRIDRNAAAPVAVSVPEVGIAAPVIPLGLKPNGKLEVPQDFSDAGWREGGPEPGERGAAMITAHVDSRSGPAAFYRLDDVRAGYDIKVRRKDRTTVTFVAERSEWVDKDHFPTRRVYGRTGLPTLRLVTCGGAFNAGTGHYEKNLIVYATRKPS